MPLGIVSDKEFSDELNNVSHDRSEKDTNKNDNVVITGEVISPKSPGRNKGDVNVPTALRKMIADEHIINGRANAVELASYFSLSHQSADGYKYGTSPNDSSKILDERSENSKELTNHITNTKNRIIRRAHNKLALTLNNITPEKLQDARLKDLAIVAKSLSGVIRDMEPDKNGNGDSKLQPQFIVYAPRMMKEEYYETLIVND